jgi:hypothetical protein
MTFIRYTQRERIGNTKKLKVFGNNKIRGPKQNSQNRLMSSMTEKGESYECFISLLKTLKNNINPEFNDRVRTIINAYTDQ